MSLKCQQRTCGQNRVKQRTVFFTRARQRKLRICGPKEKARREQRSRAPRVDPQKSRRHVLGWRFSVEQALPHRSFKKLASKKVAPVREVYPSLTSSLTT